MQRLQGRRVPGVSEEEKEACGWSRAKKDKSGRTTWKRGAGKRSRWAFLNILSKTERHWRASEQRSGMFQNIYSGPCIKNID